MKKHHFTQFIGVLLLSTILTGCIQEERQSEQEKTITDLAIEFMTHLIENKYQEAFTYFSEEMKDAITLKNLQEIWVKNIQTYGSFQTIDDFYQTSLQGFDVIYINCTFENNYKIKFRLVFNTQKQIAGFWLDDITSLSDYNIPEYVDTSRFSEMNISIGADPWVLPATLSIPQGPGPFPCVILIHGSGPQDRDETIGPNKPFKDMAWGLASNNITVLRYDKRTYVHSDDIDQFDNFTVDDEIIQDVLFAVNTMMVQSYVPIDSIILLGHSLGAMMIPQIIAQDETSIDGGIFLAAPARPLEDLILNQTIFLLNSDGELNSSEKIIIDETQTQIQRIKTLNFTENETILSASKSYWRYLSTYDQITTAQQLSHPLLFLQGKRDYQVTYEDDYLRWYDALSSSSLVTFQSYERLNHLFISGDGPPTNTEYFEPGNVDRAVMEDIIEWIQP